MQDNDLNEWAAKLYPRAEQVVATIEQDASHVFSLTGEVPVLHPIDAIALLKRFDDVFEPFWATANRPVFQSSSSNEIDLVTKFLSKRISDISTSINDGIIVSAFEPDQSWLEDFARPKLYNVVGLVSVIGGINSVRGTGKTAQIVDDFFDENAEIVVHAFASLEDPVEQYLKRTMHSDYAPFGGVLLSFMNTSEQMVFENRRMADFDRGQTPESDDYLKFNAYALREMLSYEDELPREFWDKFFQVCYGSEAEDPGIIFPGSFRWVENLGLVELYADLADRYSGFLDALVKFDSNPSAVVQAISATRTNSSPDLGI